MDSGHITCRGRCQRKAHMDDRRRCIGRQARRMGTSFVLRGPSRAVLPTSGGCGRHSAGCHIHRAMLCVAFFGFLSFVGCMLKFSWGVCKLLPTSWPGTERALGRCTAVVGLRGTAPTFLHADCCGCGCGYGRTNAGLPPGGRQGSEDVPTLETSSPRSRPFVRESVRVVCADCR